MNETDEITTDYASIFKSYREYVGLCIEAGEDVPTLSEFLGKTE